MSNVGKYMIANKRGMNGLLLLRRSDHQDGMATGHFESCT